SVHQKQPLANVAVSVFNALVDCPVELAKEVVELFMLLLGFSLCAQERKAETEKTILVNTSLMSFFLILQR
ncbi:hypothetical protein, partial [Rhizobium leguminosarum]|uniref:hypothetical protein n=1 Tax=Rhizobium leguminosarum TaxID=384 RepID=UPI003F9727E7